MYWPLRPTAGIITDMRGLIVLLCAVAGSNRWSYQTTTSQHLFSSSRCSTAFLRKTSKCFSYLYRDRVGLIYIVDIYHWYRIFSIYTIFMEFFYFYFLKWHIVTMFCWLMTCAVSIFSVLDNFCQIAPLHSNAVWMTRVLPLICKEHTNILLFGSKFYILAMYVQMLNI